MVPESGCLSPAISRASAGLAGTCGAEQHEELAIRNLEIEIGHRGVTAEFLGDAFKPDVSHVDYPDTSQGDARLRAEKMSCDSSICAQTVCPGPATKPLAVLARKNWLPNFRSTMSYAPSGSMRWASIGM